MLTAPLLPLAQPLAKAQCCPRRSFSHFTFKDEYGIRPSRIQRVVHGISSVKVVDTYKRLVNGAVFRFLVDYPSAYRKRAIDDPPFLVAQSANRHSSTGTSGQRVAT